MGDLDWQSIFAALDSGGRRVGNDHVVGGQGQSGEVGESGTRLGHPSNLHELSHSQQYQSSIGSSSSHLNAQQRPYNHSSRPRHVHRHSLPLPPLPSAYQTEIQTQLQGQQHPVDPFLNPVPPPTPLIPLQPQPHRTMSDQDFYNSLTRSLYSHESGTHLPGQASSVYHSRETLDQAFQGGINDLQRDSGPTAAHKELEARTRTKGTRSIAQQGEYLSLIAVDLPMFC
jgi:hypothetical protein